MGRHIGNLHMKLLAGEHVHISAGACALGAHKACMGGQSQSLKHVLHAGLGFLGACLWYCECSSAKFPLKDSWRVWFVLGPSKRHPQSCPFYMWFHVARLLQAKLGAPSTCVPPFFLCLGPRTSIARTTSLGRLTAFCRLSWRRCRRRTSRYRWTTKATARFPDMAGEGGRGRGREGEDLPGFGTRETRDGRNDLFCCRERLMFDGTSQPDLSFQGLAK